jgi:hypothetical protein
MQRIEHSLDVTSIEALIHPLEHALVGRHQEPPGTHSPLNQRTTRASITSASRRVEARLSDGSKDIKCNLRPRLARHRDSRFDRPHSV